MGYKMSGPSLYSNVQRSSHGYRKGHAPSESKVIPSNEISMKEEDGDPLEKGDIKGTGLTTGNTKIMKPGKNYTFAGDNEVLETPMLEKKSKAKWRKDGTLKKVITKDKETGYKSKIKFDKEGRIKSAKNNKTKNKHKKSKQRLSSSKWVKEDMLDYSTNTDIISTKNYGPKKKVVEVKKTKEENRNQTYNRT